MPQATSAQREPSMEEILASIRRIIEDSDSGKRDDGAQARGAQRPQAGRTGTEVDAFRAELRAAPEPEQRNDHSEARREASEPTRPVPVAAEPAAPARLVAETARPEPAPVARVDTVPDRKPISLAEIQAEMRRVPAPAKMQASAIEPVVQSDARPLDALDHAQPEDTRPAVSMADIQALLDKGPPAFAPLEDTDDEPEAPEPPALPRMTFEPANRSVAPAPVPAPVVAHPVAEARSPEPAAPAPKPSIVSAEAGRQVAAAFGELSAAFAASRQKSFDEMAEQMMRPMLQEWMDNNLPLLVERLVREEIERVARGA
ncbi:MAG: DUF2497 domain-containing protein [Rhizobiaceae bacterium]|nr:DUF2497 domain-containing protein [Rhizobiaceae bacterium]